MADPTRSIGVVADDLSESPLEGSLSNGEKSYQYPSAHISTHYQRIFSSVLMLLSLSNLAN